MCIVTSVWTRLCSFSSQRPVKNMEVQEINPSNEAGCRSRANRAGSSLCSPSCRPHGSNQLTLEHWHLWERGPTTTAFTTSSLRAHGFLTQLHNINKHVCTQEVKQSNPSGTECWQGMSKRRVGAGEECCSPQKWDEGQSKGSERTKPGLTHFTQQSYASGLPYIETERSSWHHNSLSLTWPT